VVAGEDDDVLHQAVLDVAEHPRVLAHGVRGALEPVSVGRRLRCREHLHEALTRNALSVVRLAQVAVERGRVELREDVDLGDAAVQAVAHRHVDQAVRAADWHRRLGALLGQGVQAAAGTTAEDDR